MAIIIPSKNIFDISNQKITKNKIKSIEVNATEVFQVKKQRETVTEEDRKDITFAFKHTQEERETVENGKLTNPRIFATSFVQITSYYDAVVYPINKVQRNKIIEKMYEGEQNISVSVFGSVYTNKQAKGTISVPKGSGIEDIKIEYSPPESTEYLEDFSLFPTSFTSTVETDGLYASKTLELENKSNINTASFELTKEEDGSEYYKIYLKLLSKIEVSTLGGKVEKGDIHKDVFYGDLEGEFTVYEAKEIKINFLGDTTEYDTRTKVLKYGDTDTKNVFSIEGNDLLQSTNKYFVTEDDYQDAIEYNIKKTLEEYTNGKETAEILCSIDEYKNEEGEIAIDLTTYQHPMSFNIGDEVIPMVRNPRGIDEPMSKNKVYKVIGANFYYDGAVWQKLTLLEK
jgi:hypothetical protein